MVCKKIHYLLVFVKATFISKNTRKMYVHTTIFSKLYFLGVQYIVSNILIVLTAQMEIEPYSVLEVEKSTYKNYELITSPTI